MISRCRISALAALALMAGLSCDAANAAKSDGNYFEIGPQCCQVNSDISNALGIDLSTADAAISNGVLKLASTARHPIYTDGSNWVSNTQVGISSYWSAENGEALRKDFSDWPTYRVKLVYYPDSECTGYLAAFSSRGKLMVQKTFTSNIQTELDTGALKGRIGYILASFDSQCGRLGRIGYYHNLH